MSAIWVVRPQPHDPAQQRHKTGRDVQLGAFAAGLVFGIQTPFVQALFEVGDLLAEQHGWFYEKLLKAPRGRSCEK